MRQWRVGSITAGVLLVVLGVIWLASLIWDVSLARIIFYAWPVLLILLGVEILAYQRKKSEESMRFDGVSILIVLLVLGATLITYPVYASGIFPAIQSFLTDQTHDVQMEDQLQVDETISEVRITGENGSFSIDGTADTDVLVSATMRLTAGDSQQAEQLAEEAISLRTVGDTLIIHIEDPRGYHWFPFRSFSSHVDVSLPSELPVDVNVQNGNIHVAELHNSVTVQTTNGRIHAQQMSGDGRLETTNGRIELIDMEGEWQVRSSNGQINGSNLQGSLRSETTNGRINLQAKSIDGDWYVSTTNGNVSLHVPEQTDANIQASTTNGSIRGDIDWQREGSSEVAVLGDETHRIVLEGVNSQISVHQH